MSVRELILLSPYRLPAQNPLMLGNEDIASFMNGLSVLWHPAVVMGAIGPPRIASPYDYEQPGIGHLYAVPESPPLVLPEDWDQRVRDAGSVSFRATPDRDGTLANLRNALRSAELESAARTLLDLGLDKVSPFFGIGFGQRMIETLFEAMDHEYVLATADFWADVQAAATALGGPDVEAVRKHLQSAAGRLQAAREVLYPVTIHLLDLCLLDDQRPSDHLPASFDKGSPLNIIGPAAVLQKLGQECPERLAALKQAIEEDRIEVCGGCYLERADALLPIESQLWNLLTGLASYRELLGHEVFVYARKRFAAHPQMPLLLNSVGVRRALLLAFDESVLPTYKATVVSWPSPDGKQVDAFTRMPYPADNAQTGFHWAHYLHKTIAQDHAATLGLLHAGNKAGPWYDDLLELSRLAPVFGYWTTLSRYLTDVLAGEYASAGSADDFHGDYLSERTSALVDGPVSGFALQVRMRRRLDTMWTLAALNRGLYGVADRLRLQRPLSNLEWQAETGACGDAELCRECGDLEREIAGALAERLLAHASVANPGYLLLNPCSFTRRLAVELEGFGGPAPLEGPLKACQVDGTIGRLVVEVPALGFAWIPKPADAATAPPAPSRMRLADSKCVRNEFFEAEIDPVTGGLRGLRDHRTRISRIGQQLVFNPGSFMQAGEVRVTSTGPALGEIITEGAIFDEHQQVLALFRQRFRAWLGRPLLELRIELKPQHLPQGYPWHAYYGARFAWRDERAALVRGVNGTGSLTTQTRPETPDYLELRSSRHSTVLFPGGLPFHQRHGSRMLDIILLPGGEKAQAFEIGIALDREYPMQTALGMVTPTVLVPVSKGPPRVGSAGWLFHLNAPNLLMTTLRPAADDTDAVVARFLECSNFATAAELRCVRDPKRAELMDAQGTAYVAASISGDTVHFEVASGDLTHLRVEFG